jgi:two-component system NtrC family sensor kinase
MTFLRWSEHFVTHIDGVDRQHQGLVELVNAAAPALSCGDPSAADAQALIDRLAEYATTHFREEEQLMRDAGIDSNYLNQHVRSHRSFVEEVALMRRQVDTDSRLDGPQLLRFLASWLTFHILVEDQHLARQLRLLADQHSPAEAVALGRERRSESVQGVLTGALIDLFAVVSQRNRALVQINDQLQAAQSRLGELNASLEQQVTERTHELQRTNTELLHEQKALHQALETIERTQSQLLQSEKMSAVGQLAAGVAHEINNPIGFVSSNLGSLKHYVGQLLDIADADAPAIAALAADHPARLAAEQARQASELDFLRQDVPDLIRESADGLARVRKIVADLQDFSHVDQAEWLHADLNRGLESTLNVVSGDLKYKARIVRDFGDLPAVRCIPAQLNQVFMNLLVNAGQAIETTGTITLRTGHADGDAWIEIEDTGSGIPPEVQGRIFEPFFTTKPVGKGTGLGLSISWEIVQRHGGTISVDSEAGRGTCFRVRLPIAGPSLGGGKGSAR